MIKCSMLKARASSGFISRSRSFLSKFNHNEKAKASLSGFIPLKASFLFLKGGGKISYVEKNIERVIKEDPAKPKLCNLNAAAKKYDVVQNDVAGSEKVVDTTTFKYVKGRQRRLTNLAWIQVSLPLDFERRNYNEYSNRNFRKQGF